MCELNNSKRYTSEANELNLTRALICLERIPPRDSSQKWFSVYCVCARARMFVFVIFFCCSLASTEKMQVNRIHCCRSVLDVQMWLAIFLGVCAIGGTVSPFKNRPTGGSVNSGVMLNTANLPNLINQVHNHGHGHGHSVRPPAHVIFGGGGGSGSGGDKYHQYQTPAHGWHHPHHYHYHHTNPQHHHYTSTTHTHKRQFRNPFDVIYEWRQLDFEYPSFLDRQRAILNGDFIPTNNLPLGVDRWRNRLFVTMPRWKNGVPASLATLPLPAIERSPPMR